MNFGRHAAMGCMCPLLFAALVAKVFMQKEKRKRMKEKRGL